MESGRNPGGCARASLNHRLISQAPPGPLQLRSHSRNRQRPDPKVGPETPDCLRGKSTRTSRAKDPAHTSPGPSPQLPSKKKFRRANGPAYRCRRGACSGTPRKRRRHRSSATAEPSSKLNVESRMLEVQSQTIRRRTSNIQHSTSKASRGIGRAFSPLPRWMTDHRGDAPVWYGSGLWPLSRQGDAFRKRLRAIRPAGICRPYGTTLSDSDWNANWRELTDKKTFAVT